MIVRVLFNEPSFPLSKGRGTIFAEVMEDACRPKLRAWISPVLSFIANQICLMCPSPPPTARKLISLCVKALQFFPH